MSVGADYGQALVCINHSIIVVEMSNNSQGMCVTYNIVSYDTLNAQ